MKTETIYIDNVVINGDNPRRINEKMLDSLINSILVFPKMLLLRPIVIDEDNIVLGGNMRLKALQTIAEFTANEAHNRLIELNGYQTKSVKEQEELLDYWTAWTKKQDITVVRASELNEEERKEFIIKDNIAFGVWDYSVLEEWNNVQLIEWGLDVSFAATDVDMDGFFEESSKTQEDKQPKMVTCPHCGKEHEI